MTCILLTDSTITLRTFTFFSSNPPEREFNSQTAEVYQKAKEQLTNDSRQFVTASKLFVKSATENEQQLLECLGHCVHLIDRIGSVTYDVALYTPTPQQTLGLLVSHFFKHVEFKYSGDLIIGQVCFFNYSGVASGASSKYKFPIICENPPLYICSHVTIQVKLFCVSHFFMVNTCSHMLVLDKTCE